MNTNLEKQISELEIKFKTYSTFYSRWKHKLPEDEGIFNLVDSTPALIFYCYNSNRDTVLAVVGEIFGKDGWERKLHYTDKSYDWRKVVDGVRIELNEAELIPPPVKPDVVQPREFPLALTCAPTVIENCVAYDATGIPL